ncbi:hypothetical protein MPTK1_5g22290 [Marchantia polymorpha subsp. ruderalis]|nr:hypothetical protein MARPO_0166s0023 [Marchantia polymorpha]BBN12712.1 hypothetical protein Mp_5g22290 [Marchantia polymorpha subsp. ruderalis]|eukprot:PTQ28368.1 hypothetical protein MARPO_0166s0023 [Marchantia polymorpha]
MAAIVVAGISYLTYRAYNKHKEKEAKKNDPGLIFHAKDQKGDARVRKIKNRVIIHGRLVYGMYDRFRRAPETEYKEWWTKVHYHLVPLESVLTEKELQLYETELEAERQHQYFGVFKRNKDSPLAEAPEWVVAIRGTEPEALVDLYNDAKIVLETLNSSTLIPLLEYVVRRLSQQHKHYNVHVTGHSLGAAAGLLVCRRLALEGYVLEGHFFNPPFTTVESLARSCAHVVEGVIKDALPEKVGHFYDFAKSTAKSLYHAVADADTEKTARKKKQAFDDFNKLAQANWSPYLYVNKHDLISRKFVSHFTKKIQGPVGEDPKKWYSSFTEFSEKLLGETETFHLFPSAHLVLTNTTCLQPVSAHMLWNWIDPNLSFTFEHTDLNPRPSST